MLSQKPEQIYRLRYLKKIGADEIVYPERDVAEKVAVRHNSHNIFDYIQLTSEYAIYEVPVVKSWIGKTVIDIDIRKHHNVNVIAVATLADASCIILTEGSEIGYDVIAKAEACGVNILRTAKFSYEICCTLGKILNA